jgi:thiol:disulfide interchange protein
MIFRGFLQCLFVFFLTSESLASSIQWESYSDAINAAKSDHKLVFVDLYANWCISCRIMDANVFSDSSVAKLLNLRFHPVKLDVESKDSIVCDYEKKTPQRCFFDVWKLTGIPSLVLIAPNGLTILTLTQMLEPSDLRFLLFQFLKKEKEWISK